MLTISAEPSFSSHEAAEHGAPSAIDALVQSIRDGDDRAASVLLEKLYPLVLKIVRSHLPPRTSEEDLCQTIFVRIFHRLDQYSGLAPFEHWVSRIAVNVCLNQIETERIRPELRYADLSEGQAQIVEQLASTPADLPDDKSEEAREIISRLLLRLKPADRLVITMLHLEEKSLAEIKALTGWGAIVIKVRAHRARQKLKHAYAQLIKTLP